MEGLQKNRAAVIALVGVLILAVIMVGGTFWMGRAAQRDTAEAARSVSLLYLDELAGRRKQVVEDNLRDNIKVINLAISLLDDEALSDLAHLQAYQRQMKLLFNLERFAFVNADGLIYTSMGVQTDIDEYSLDLQSLTEPVVFVRNPLSAEKKVVIAVPVDGITFQGGPLVACFMEQDMKVMLQGVSIQSQTTDATFCNLYTTDGITLSNIVLGGLSADDNLLEALRDATFEPGYSLEKVTADFAAGHRGVVSFAYNGIQETLSYAPVDGAGWMMTYLVQESVIREQISSVSSGIIMRSVAQSLLTAAVLGIMFAFILSQNRRNAQLRLEKETSEAENRVKHQAMEQRLILQDQLLKQKAERDQQEKMIAALASDYRSVYFLELDKDRGVCYQSRADMDGLHTGETFNYLEAVTAYCNQHVLEPYREEFLRFIQPDALREGLKRNRVVSYRYMIDVGGVESYEMVRFASVRPAEGGDAQTVNNVGACFTDVDAETREALSRNQALSDALNAARQASKAKTAFLSNMSHEIRTPMNAIIGLNNIALNEPNLPGRTREYLEKIGVSAQHLLGIINDILDMSRIESGRMVIKNEEFSFARCLEQVNTIISGQCRDKGVHYDCHTVGRIDDYYVGDEMKLKQVMINILGNAVKFTPAGGNITFLIEEGRRFDRKAVLKLTMADTGIGMSADYLPHLFDAFSQEDSSATNRYGSTGLGMPITKSIVELMNGSIEVESEKGVGTTFRVTVTLEESTRKPSALDTGELNPAELSVLVIDDDPIALEHARIIFSQVGIYCETAESGAEGLELVRMRHARREDYNLLLIDWRMPELDGVETTRQIRAIVGPDTPIIILTSYNWDEIAEEAKVAGVDSFAAKPLFAENVLDEFREAFKRKSHKPGGKPVDLKGRRVLLAEDVPVNAEIMVMVLSMREIETDVAENGRVAVDMFTAHPEGYYDAILMDMRMPEMDGLEATRLIRASGRADATLPIIALTANAFDEDVQRSLQAGLNAHLSKPVEPEDLYRTLEELL